MTCDLCPNLIHLQALCKELQEPQLAELKELKELRLMLHPHLAAVRQLDQTFGQSAGRVPTNIELEQTAKQLRGISKQVELHHREVKPTHSLMPS